MVTKATIEEKVDKYRFRVRIPIYNKQKDAIFATPTKELDIALVCTLPGCNVNYQVGDVVYVGFDDAQDYEPVILGLLYREKDTGTLMSITAESLKTKVSTELSQHTSIGNINEFNIKALYGANESLQREIERLQKKLTPTTYSITVHHQTGIDDGITFAEGIPKSYVDKIGRIDVQLDTSWGIMKATNGCTVGYVQDTNGYNLVAMVDYSVIDKFIGDEDYTITIRVYEV